MRLAVLLVGAVAITHAPGSTQTKLQDLPSVDASKITSIDGAGREDRRDRRALIQFAQCSLDRRPAEIYRYLAGPLRGGEDGLTLSNLVSSACHPADGAVSMAPETLRGAMFTVLWRRKTAEALTVGSTPAMPPVHFGDPRPATPREQLYIEQVKLATCVVAGAAGASSVLVNAREGTSAEDEAMKAIQPALQTCVAEERTVLANRSQLKGALAEALYRSPASEQQPQTVQPEVKN